MTVALDAGVYGVFYEETGYVDKYEELKVPNGLEIEVASAGGSRPAIFQRAYTGNHVTGSGSTAREIGKITTPAGGRYTVTVASDADAALRARHDPAITIGHTYADIDKKFTMYFVIGGGLLAVCVLGGFPRRWRMRSS
jgi:hypothetical protein